MPENISVYLNNAMIILALLSIIIVIFRMAYQWIRNRYGPVRSVKAQVAEKYVEDQFSKIYGSVAKKPQHYVVFLIGKKKRAFRVSEFSYQGYKIHERGTLKYKGSRLIDFR